MSFLNVGSTKKIYNCFEKDILFGDKVIQSALNFTKTLKSSVLSSTILTKIILEMPVLLPFYTPHVVAECMHFLTSFAKSDIILLFFITQIGKT